MAVRDAPQALLPHRALRRVAMLVVHSSPVAEPGVGDAGGMTVYVRQMARTLAARGLEVDIYTRRDSADTPEAVELFPGVVVRQVTAGLPGLSKEEVPAHLPAFTANLARDVERRGVHYDLIHSHYWLSGKVAGILASRWGIPFVHTFHTLGRVKNEGRAHGEAVEPDSRLRGEARVIAEADAIVASAPDERDWLIDLYAAHPERIHVIPPGVDHTMFRPGDREGAKARLGLAGRRVLLFVGRLQPLKGIDTAIEALAHLIEWRRLGQDEAALVIVGGASGVTGPEEPRRLRDLVQSLGLGQAVRFVPAQPHADLPGFYQAADVCLVPSHNESFGLVALEAQACGTPVVGAAVGGLRSIVRHGQTGYLVEPGASAAFAERIWRVLSDPPLADSMGRLAVCSSGDFSWDRSASELYDLYAASARDAALARLATAPGPAPRPRFGPSRGAGPGARRNFSGREEISDHALDAPGAG
ncbi:MAG: D-inositol-3-phosphate glycosyltransferase [Actinomycetota bacterium]